MDIFNLLMNGFSIALSLENIGAAMLGAVLGIIVGAMPGIGSLVGVALLLPLTFKFNPTTAIIMLGAIYYANMFGGAFSAILLNIPGDAPAIMTTLDGFPLAQKGKPGKALMTANVSSFIGGLIGIIVLTLIGPLLAQIGLMFGPAEMASLMLLAMSSISWLVGESPVKGVVATCLGMLLATIGMDAVTGDARYYFGSVYLVGGLNFIPLVVGFIGMSQVYEMTVARTQDKVKADDIRLRFRDCFLSWSEWKRILPPAIRSGLMGSVIGVVPGSGATMASFLGYAIQKKIGKNEEELGTGAVEGIASCEAANNAAAAGAFGPLLSLGIPGSGTTAVLLGGLLMWGLNPGPRLFSDSPEFAWGLIASLYIANIIALGIAFAVIPWIMRIIKVPSGVMIPAIVSICFVSAFATSNSMFSVIVMLLGGIGGYLFKKFDYPNAPMLLSFILASMLEVNLRRAFVLSKGSAAIFFEKPMSLAFLIVFAVIVCTPIVKKLLKKKTAQQ